MATCFLSARQSVVTASTSYRGQQRGPRPQTKQGLKFCCHTPSSLYLLSLTHSHTHTYTHTHDAPRMEELKDTHIHTHTHTHTHTHDRASIDALTDTHTHA